MKRGGLLKVVGIFTALLIFQSSFAAAPITSTPQQRLTKLEIAARETNNFPLSAPHEKANLQELQRRMIQMGMGTAEFSAGALQTVILIAIISGVKIFQDEFEHALITGSAVSLQDASKISLKASQMIINSPSIWMGILGSPVTETAFAPAIQIFNFLISNTATSAIMKTLLASGIHSFVSFLGWELASHLWEEARGMLSEPADYERAGRFFSLGFGSIHNLEDRATLNKMLQNMAQILITDSALRKQWFYNCWRLRLATGDFTILIGSMVAATTVGTALFPGAGTILGLCFGVAGGIASLQVPEDVKKGISESIRFTRRQYNRTAGHLSRSLEKRRKYREEAANTYFEAAFEAIGEIDRLSFLVLEIEVNRSKQPSVFNRLMAAPKLAKQVMITGLISTLSQEGGKIIREYYDQGSPIARKQEREVKKFKDSLRAAVSFYEAETLIYRRLYYKTANQELRDQITAERLHIEDVAALLKDIEEGLASRIGGTNSQPNETQRKRAELSLRVFNSIYLKGLNEEKLVPRL